jgi:hypothetical protein
MGLLFLLLSIIPQPDGVLRDTVGVIEINHHYKADATLRHHQLIFWDWHENVVIPAKDEEFDHCMNIVTCPPTPEWRGPRFMCVDWRVLRGPHMLPIRDWRNGGYVIHWTEVQGGQEREVRALSIRETWTQDQFDTDKLSDPESYENEMVLPKEKRRHLKEAAPVKPFVHEWPAETPDAH